MSVGRLGTIRVWFGHNGVENNTPVILGTCVFYTAGGVVVRQFTREQWLTAKKFSAMDKLSGVVFKDIPDDWDE